MKPLDADGFQEVLDIEAEGQLDRERALVHAAQLREFRRLDRMFRRGRTGVVLELARMPALDDLAAWKRLVAAGAGAREAAQPGAPDLLSERAG